METDDELRRELEEASENVRAQIDALGRSMYSQGGGYDGDRLALQRLNETLSQLEEALSNLGAENATDD